MAKKLPKRTKKLKLPDFQAGGVIEDPMGQWKYPGQVTRIPGTDITMQGVNYPVLGVSDTGDTKMMQPGGNYKFHGNHVTEYPQQSIGKSQTGGGGGLKLGGKLPKKQTGGNAFPVSLQERQNWNDFARYAHQDPNFGNADIYDKDTQYGYNKLQEYNKTHPENLIRTPDDVARVQQGFTMLKANPGQYGYAGNWSSGKDLKVDRVIGTQTSSTLFPSVSETINQGKQSTTTNYGQDYEKYQAAHPVAPAATPVTASIAPAAGASLAMNQFGGNVETSRLTYAGTGDIQRSKSSLMNKTRKIQMAQNGTGLSGPVLRSGPNVKNSAPPNPIVTEAPRAYVVNNTFPMQQGGHVGYNWQTPEWEIVDEMQNGGNTEYSWAQTQPRTPPSTTSINTTNYTTTQTKELKKPVAPVDPRLVGANSDNAQISSYEPQGMASKIWEVATHPATAMGYVARNQRLPDNFSRGNTSLVDYATDIVNPAFYAGAVGRTVKNVVSPQTYTDLPKTLAAAVSYAGTGEAPPDWSGAARRTLGRVGDATVTAGIAKPLADAALATKFSKDQALRIGSFSSSPARSLGDLRDIYQKGIKVDPASYDDAYTGNFGDDPKRNLLKNYLFQDETGFEPSDYKLDHPEWDPYKKRYGDLKAFKMDAEVSPETPIHIDDLLESFHHKTKEELLSRLDKEGKINTITEASRNPIHPYDNITKHIGILEKHPTTGDISFTSRDLWSFTPEEYNKSWGNQMTQQDPGLSKLSSKFRQAQSYAMDKAGKPFVLHQTNPVDITPRKSYVHNYVNIKDLEDHLKGLSAEEGEKIFGKYRSSDFIKGARPSLEETFKRIKDKDKYIAKSFDPRKYLNRDPPEPSYEKLGGKIPYWEIIE